jgi:hypothetical protein
MTPSVPKRRRAYEKEREDTDMFISTFYSAKKNASGKDCRRISALSCIQQ